MACATQWRVGPAGRIGLDYAACQIAVEPLRARLTETPNAPTLPPWLDLLPDLQTIEHAMLSCDREQRDREAAAREAGRSKP